MRNNLELMMISMSDRWLLKAVPLLAALVLGSAGLSFGSQELMTPVTSSGAWCGPRAVYAICKAEGETIPFSDILEWCKCDEAGNASVKDIEAALRRAGFN